ncbi:MAG TPA: hypothetical protein VNR66_11835, partial [Solirubrobacteraceae bacterium]|nr:hypothetical protein [Solirubrobacteraceae bacterium]
MASLCVAGAAAPDAGAKVNPLKPVCGAAKLASGVAGKACGVLQAPGKVLSAGKKLLTGHVGSAVSTLLGGGGSTAGAAVGLAALGAWVVGGARFALGETAKVIGRTTNPQLGGAWFSSAYWRMGEIAALLTMPFLFAAAAQAVIRADLALLARAALGYLPLALIAVGIAAPMTMLLLAASDQLSAVVAGAAGGDGTRFLVKAGGIAGALAVFKGSPFLAFLVGLLAAAGALVLWFELLMREAAVYVVVLMLPLAFAAMVWPSRRVWATRAVELLIALILAKFAIVSVLSLGGAALGHRGGTGIVGALAGAVLVLLGAFAPWALLRLLPVTELAGHAVGPLRAEARAARMSAEEGAYAWAGAGADWAGGVTAAMRRDADRIDGVDRWPAAEDPSGERPGSETLAPAGEPVEEDTGPAAGAALDVPGPESPAAAESPAAPDSAAAPESLAPPAAPTDPPTPPEPAPPEPE